MCGGAPELQGGSVDATLQQIAALTAAGCQIVGIAVPSQDDTEALSVIARKSQMPVIADIHFQPKYGFRAIDAGCAAVRAIPDYIKRFDDKTREIGVKAGSLDQRLLVKYGKTASEVIVESALRESPRFEEHGFTDIKISVKHHDPPTSLTAYVPPNAATLHSASPRPDPHSKAASNPMSPSPRSSARASGDAIQVSLTADHVE